MKGEFTATLTALNEPALMRLLTPPDELPRVLPRPVMDCRHCRGRRTLGVHRHTAQCRRCGSVWGLE